MISSVVLCPHPPLLLRELGGQRDAVPELRAACGEVLAEALREAPDRVVVVGGAETAGDWDPSMRADVRSFGTTAAPTGPALPLSLGVGARLLEEAGWAGPVELVSVALDAGSGDLDRLARELEDRPGRSVLLLLGDGSARRGEKAPGFLDERSFGFDESVRVALETGDAEALRHLDGDLAGELMALGLPVFWLLGAVTGDSDPEPQLVYAGDPFGVMYFVAIWRLT